jgi:hypothetical protein
LNAQEFVEWGAQFNAQKRPKADDLWKHKFLELACVSSHMKKKLKAIFLMDNLNDAMY